MLYRIRVAVLLTVLFGASLLVGSSPGLAAPGPTGGAHRHQQSGTPTRPIRPQTRVARPHTTTVLPHKSARPRTAARTADALASFDTPTFHGDSQRLGWDALESDLSPATVSSSAFGPLWDSPQFDSVTIGGTTYAPHLYASPLYLDSVAVTGGDYAGLQLSVVLAATSNGYVYAVNAFDGALPAGTILWRASLGNPGRVGGLDGGVPLGVLGTPVIDTSTTPPRLYVASDVTSGSRYWEVFALDVGSGTILPGWPVTINDSTLSEVNQNGPARFQTTTAMSQRGALNLSLDGSRLYVPFGAYGDGGAGWMVAIDTFNPSVVSAFSGAPSTAAVANGGMWGAGGPAVDEAGYVYDTTGNSPPTSHDTPGVWGNSLLAWASAPGPLQLVGTYSPFNYCQMDVADTDLGGSSPMILPDLDPSTTATPYLISFGGKQGNVYLVDRYNLPGALDRRQPCSTDSTTDGSLLPPNDQPQFGAPGPLNVFGPYSENCTQGDNARARSTTAYYQGADGTSYLFASGSTKAAACSTTVVPPSLARLVVVTAPGQPAYLAVDATDNQLTFINPGSPVVTSNGFDDPIVWVLDANLFRSQPLIGTSVPHPVLYAVDAATMNLVWRSTADQLNVGGKYSTPTIAHGVVFVGTDRIQAFGLNGPTGTRRLRPQRGR